MAQTTPEKQTTLTPSTPESLAPSLKEVSQPKSAKLGELIANIDAMVSQEVGEVSGNVQSDWSGSSGTQALGQQTGQTGISWRDEAIANLPQPQVMQKELTKHIEVQIKDLRKQVKKIARMGQPGSAYKLNELYARIRRLNGLLSHILEASVDVLKKLFIRVFVDKQTLT